MIEPDPDAGVPETGPRVDDTTTDTDNPTSTPGPFGAKSVLELPGYAAPAWLGRAAPWPVRAELAVPTATGAVDLTVRSPAVTTSRVLLVHDGPEYDASAMLGEFAAAMVSDGRLPPFQLVLAAPGARDEWYSADPAYTAALSTAVLPHLHRVLGTAGPAVLMGASLGALAALHAAAPASGSGRPGCSCSRAASSPRSWIPVRGGLPGTSPEDRGRGGRGARATDRPGARCVWCSPAARPRRTCTNNRLMAATLGRQGYPVAGCARCRTRTTTWPGGTRSTRIWRSC